MLHLHEIGTFFKTVIDTITKMAVKTAPAIGQRNATFLAVIVPVLLACFSAFVVWESTQFWN